MSWGVWLLVAVNVAVAVWTGRETRRGRHALLRADARSLQAISDRARLQHAIGDEPQVALSVVCEYLEQLVTPAPGPTDDELREWLREERW